MMRRLPDRFIVACIVALGLTFAVSMLERWTAFSDLTNWTYDFLVNHAGYAPTSKEVVFVDFDDATFAQIQKYPIPRSTVADVITKVGRAKPAIAKKGYEKWLAKRRSPRRKQKPRRPRSAI